MFWYKRSRRLLPSTSHHFSRGSCNKMRNSPIYSSTSFHQACTRVLRTTTGVGPCARLMLVIKYDERFFFNNSYRSNYFSKLMNSTHTNCADLRELRQISEKCGLPARDIPFHGDRKRPIRLAGHFDPREPGQRETWLLPLQASEGRKSRQVSKTS